MFLDVMNVERQRPTTFAADTPVGVLQATPLIWRPSLVKYNSRMAQTKQWLPAIQSCMKKVRLNISTVPPTLPITSGRF